MKVYKNIRQDKKFIICSFYTSGEYYESIFLDKLFPSLKKFDLPYHIEEIESLHSYQLNTGMKPLYVEKMLISYPTTDIIWIDADAEIVKYPILFEKIHLEYDMALYYVDMDKWHNTDKYNGMKQLSTGIAMFRCRRNVRDIVSDWRARVVIDPQKTWDQKHLEIAVEKYAKKCIFNLPIEYSYMATMPDGSSPYIKVDPVIIQHQAGRKVNRGLVSI